RALLIAKAPAGTKIIDENNEIKSSHMNEFVIQVDVSQQIIDVSSQLVELGHFGYRDFKASTRSTREMEDLLQMLTDHLNEWQEIVNKAQEEYYYLTFFLARYILTFYDYFTSQEDHEKNKNKCSMLLRLVNDEAKLPVITEEDSTIFREYDNYSDILCAIGIKLHDIFIEVPRNRPITANVEHSIGYCSFGTTFCCDPSTRAEELFIFTKRCYLAAKNGYKKFLLCIANVEYLKFDLQYRLIMHIRSLCQQESQFNLALICCCEKGTHHHILDQLSEHIHVTEGLDAESMRNIYKELCPNVVAVSSDLSGQGKTEWIKECCFKNDLIPRSFLISDGMTFGELVKRLSEIEFREFVSLHLNIMLIDHPYEVNMFLFELLSLRIAKNGINLACIPSTQHLTWNIDNLIISHNYNSSTQIVARYLDVYDQNFINEIDINFTKDDEPISQERCQQLFQNYFFKNRTQDVASYRFLEIFNNILADQLLSSVFFRIDMLKYIGKDKNIRKTLLETLMDVSSDFATRSVNSKADQLKNLFDAAEAANANLGTIKRWENSNHLLVFFQSRAPDFICALYRNKNKLECLARNTLEEREYPSYALSTDNLLKMTLILLRVRANVPVVCCGEVGCGKLRYGTQAGLLAKLYEKRSHLDYQVHPLPDQLLDYVWDYGALKPFDEKIYISIMVKKNLEKERLSSKLFSELLFASQEFIRRHEGAHSVSLRDVKHAIYFNKSLIDRPCPNHSSFQYPSSLGMEEEVGILVRSYILALSLGYQVRTFDQKLRKQYREIICNEKQKDYIVRMTKPLQIAENDALLENVLAMIVCIFTKIPYLLSAHLAIRLISQNLRGADSDDPYFKTLPQIYIIPHQGSSSSTSDVGLAETSPHNPLKVLLSLLEPNYPAEYPNVSVVGISNWNLTNSKSKQDLIDTADRLFENNKTWSKRFNALNTFSAKILKLKALANSYLEYEKNQHIDNFHGFRDYYSLLKSLSGSKLTTKSIKLALARNFGGVKFMNGLVDERFVNFLKAFDAIEYNHIQLSVEDFIKANLKDKNARHLMLIGKSDTIVNILTYKLRYWNKELLETKDLDVVDEKTSWDLEPVVIYGSQFPDNRDDDYQYEILSRIMICVEAGRPLILTDLEIIYGSFYDLWNQNYITVGKENDIKYYTRVALGAYSNPMVCVHKNFRCILVLDEKNVNLADPPFLSRFEKQNMSINDVLDDYMEKLVAKLADWSQQISNYIKKGEKGDTSKSEFNEHDIFIGFDKEETLQSLVIYNSNNQEFNNDDETILNKCKELLIGIATSDGIVRSKESILSLTNPEQVQNWYNFYFYEQQHENLFKYIQSLLNNNEEVMNKQGFKVIINTFSNINTDISFCLNNNLKYQVDKISTFKSKVQLQNRIKHFWLESDEEILILQCDLSIVNSGCVKLAKFIIEQYRNEYLFADKFSENPKPLKHVCIILHVQRKNDTKSSFNFMCGWDLVTIESLEPQEHYLLDYLDRSMAQILDNTYTFEEIIE
ncbi:27430_t:CDS:10, partial [Gigaspora margarita]